MSVQPSDRFAIFADIALSLVGAETAERLRAALEVAAESLAGVVAGPVSICELGMSADGRPRILWQSARGGLEIGDDDEFLDWYGRAARRSHALTATPRSLWRGCLSAEEIGRDVGLRVAIVMGPGERNGDAGALADLAAAATLRIRMQQAAMLEAKRLDDIHHETRAWLETGADIAWEAAADGILRCRRVLNRRGDVGRLVDGMNLNSLRIADNGQTVMDVLEKQGCVRSLRVELPDGVGPLPPGEGLHISGVSRLIDGTVSYIGVLVVPRGEASVPYEREAATMLAQMRGARMREEQQRREAEAMLEGLRLLLGQDSSRDKMARLVALVASCVGASGACVAERGADGKTRLLVPQQRTLGSRADAAFDVVIENARALHVSVYDIEERDGRRIADALGLDGRHLAVLALPLRGDAAFLVCSTGRPDGFAPADLDFADRLTLLLRQALLLREEQSELVQTAKMAALGQMSASIAHELRQPLNTISLAVQNLEFILEAQEIDSEAAARKVRRVLAQVERASDVIDRMRRFGRKSLGEHETLFVRSVVENVEAIMHPVLLRNDVRVEIEVPEESRVYADQLQLEQVIGNLVQNAIDAIAGVGTTHQRDRGTIRISAAPSLDEKGRTILRVEDNGPGFSPEIIERVLKPFFTTKPADRGTGLGLAICDAIIRESGGRVEVGNHASGGYVAIILPSEAPEPATPQSPLGKPVKR